MARAKATKSMSVSTMLRDLNKELAQLVAKRKAVVDTYFSECTAAVFEQHPVLESFGWRQYTPYFNDGDPCVFRACTADFVINGLDQYEADAPDGSKNAKGEKCSLYEYMTTNPRAPMSLAYKAVEKFLSQLTDDDFEHLFGDHVEVTVTRKGVEVTDYDHD